MMRLGRRTLLGSVGLAALTGGRALAAATAPPASALPKPPVARVQPVTETLHGATIVDRYRWMETVSDPEWTPFIMGQAAHARAVLDAIPGRDALQTRIAGLSGEVTAVATIQVGGRFIFTEVRPAGANTLKLMVREGPDGADRLLVDPDRYVTPGGAHYSLDYWQCSPDATHVAYGVSPAGSEDSTLRVLETATGRDLPEVIDRMPQGAPQWAPGGEGLFYTRLNPAAKKGTPN